MGSKQQESGGKVIGEEQQLIKSMAKGGGIVFIGLVLSKVTGFIYRWSLARFLTPAEYGIFFLAYSVVSLVVMFAIKGFPRGMRRYIAYYRGKNNQERIKGVILDALALILPLSLLSALLLIIFTPQVASLFKEESLATILPLLAIYIPLQSLLIFFRRIIEAFEEMKYWVLGSLIGREGVKIALTLILIYLGLGLTGASIGLMVGVSVTVIIFFWVVEKRLFGLLSSNIKAEHDWREYLSFSLPLFLSSSIHSFSSKIDTLMVGFFKTASQVGIYNVAIPLAQLLSLFLFSFSRIFSPVASKLFAQNKKKKVGALYKSVTKWIFLGTWPVFLILFFFSKQTILIIFGKEYISGAAALSLLAVGYMAVATFGVAGSIIMASGRSRVNLLNTALLAGLNISLNGILIPIYGISGAATATASSMATIKVLGLSEVYYFEKIHPFKKSLLSPLFSGLVAMSAVFLVLKLSFKTISPFYAALGGIAFLTLYAILVLYLGSFEREDLIVIEAGEQRLGIGSKISNFIRRTSN